MLISFAITGVVFEQTVVGFQSCWGRRQLHAPVHSACQTQGSVTTTLQLSQSGPTQCRGRQGRRATLKRGAAGCPRSTRTTDSPLYKHPSLQKLTRCQYGDKDGWRPSNVCHFQRNMMDVDNCYIDKVYSVKTSFFRVVFTLVLPYLYGYHAGFLFHNPREKMCFFTAWNIVRS